MTQPIPTEDIRLAVDLEHIRENVVTKKEISGLDISCSVLPRPEGVFGFTGSGNGLDIDAL